jgi:hypothetical protein
LNNGENTTTQEDGAATRQLYSWRRNEI